MVPNFQRMRPGNPSTCAPVLARQCSILVERCGTLSTSRSGHYPSIVNPAKIEPAYGGVAVEHHFISLRHVPHHPISGKTVAPPFHVGPEYSNDMPTQVSRI